jgi:hypothetical protein
MIIFGDQIDDVRQEVRKKTARVGPTFKKKAEEG